MKMWIARDRRGSRLTLHSDKPIWSEEYRVWGRWYLADLNHEEFPEVTFENSPMEVELKLIEKLKDIPPAPAVIGNPIPTN